MKSIVMCGSRRFKLEMREFANELKDLGVVVFEPYLHEGHDGWKNLSEEYKRFVMLGLTHDHFYKIKMADVVYVFNKDGYAGVSTTLEMGAAVILGKPIYAFAKDDDLSRDTLIREVIIDPCELVTMLI